MDHLLAGKVTTGLIIFGVVIFGLVRLGMGTAAASGLGHLPMWMVPARLRRFLFGETNQVPHEPKK